MGKDLLMAVDYNSFNVVSKTFMKAVGLRNLNIFYDREQDKFEAYAVLEKNIDSREYMSEFNQNYDLVKLIPAEGLESVSKKLNEKYSVIQSTVLFGTWCKLVIFGEKFVKEQMNKATFYRQKKNLIDAGCLW